MYCIKCGAEIMDEAVICPKCGCATPNYNQKTSTSSNSSDSSATLKTIAKVFMIIGCVFMGFAIIPLAWTLPMTLSYCDKIKRGEKVGTGFKVCTLLFVSVIAGILMLCDND